MHAIPRRRQVAAALLAGAVAAGAATAVAPPARAVDDCTIWFAGSAGPAWDNPANWTVTRGGAPAGRVPGTADRACAGDAPAGTTATISSTVAVDGLDFFGSRTPTLVVRDGATLSLLGSGRSAVDRLTTGRGVVEGPGELGVDVVLATGTTFGVGTLRLRSGTFRGGVRVAGGQVTQSDTLTVSGGLRIDAGATLASAGRVFLRAASPDPEVQTWSGGGTALFGIHTRLYLDLDADDTWDVRVRTEQRGEFHATRGRVVFSRLVNYRNGVLRLGEWYGGDAAVDLGGPLREIAGGGTRLALGTRTFRTSAASVTKVAGYFGTSAPFTLNAPVEVVAGGEARFRDGVVVPALSVTGGIAYVSGADVPGGIRVQPGATLQVTETPVHADVVNGGRVTRYPFGTDPEKPEAVDGDYTALPGSETRLEQLIVTGDATLAGRFVRSRREGDEITAPGGYTLLTAATVTGRWDVVAVDAVGRVRPFYTPTTFGVTVAPPAATASVS